MISIIDYGRGNLFSLQRAFERIGAAHELIETPDQIAGKEKLVLPGVGAFGDAMHQLQKRNLVEPIREAAKQEVPLLGICLGMQLMCSASYEFGDHKGLGLIGATVERLPGGDEVRIPNVGWRELHPSPDGALASLPKHTMFYFVHSFGAVVADLADVSATIRINGKEIAAAIQCEKLVGYQFHPEKSGEAGLALLKAFANG